MTLQQLRYFLAAVEHGSFSAAAETLYLAQPSLSEQVRRLEAELGVALFERAGRGLVLTEAGRTLRPHAERTLAEAEAARESVVAVRELRGGTATLGTFGTARYYLGAELAAAFSRRHPDVRLRLMGTNSAQVADAVRAGELEAGIVVLPVDDDGLEVRPALRDELLVCSADPAHLRGPLTIERLAQIPLVLADASYGTDDPTRRQLAVLAQQAGVRLDVRIDVEDAEAAIELAGGGLGATVQARGLLHAVSLVPSRLGWAPFAEPVYDTIAIIVRRGAHLSPATRALLEVADERIAAMRRELERRRARRRPAGG